MMTFAAVLQSKAHPMPVSTPMVEELERIRKMTRAELATLDAQLDAQWAAMCDASVERAKARGQWPPPE